MHVLDVTTTALVRLLIIAAILAVPILLGVAWRSGRRRLRLVVAELVNSTGQADLDGVTAGLTQLARERIDTQIRVVSERRDFIRKKLVSIPGVASDSGVAPHSGLRLRATRAVAGRRLTAARSGPPPERVLRRLDNSMAQLLSAARDVAPQQAQPAVQLLVMLVSQPRGLVVAGILQRRGSIAASRFGVTFDVLHLDGSTSEASQTFWEAEPAPGEAPASAAADDSSPQERLLGLFGTAARWVAIQLVIQTTFPHGAHGRERGLDHLLRGMLLLQSADAFPGHAALLRRRAGEDLAEAAGLLGKAKRPQPLPLAALADSLDKLAVAGPGAGQPGGGYAQAHAQYAVAIAAIERMRPPDPGLLRRTRVRQAICWLASAQPGPCARAINWLSGPEPTLLEPRAATDLYDLACLYALASEETVATTDADPAAWRATAARFLVRALVADLPAKTLWAAAAKEPQLHALSQYLPDFTMVVSDTVAFDDDSGKPVVNVEEIVERAFPPADGPSDLACECRRTARRGRWLLWCRRTMWAMHLPAQPGKAGRDRVA